MFQNNFFVRVASFFTILAYSSTALMAPAAQAAGGFYRPLMNDLSGVYGKASAAAAKKQDIQVFLKAFGPQYLNATDAAFVAKSFSSAEMPQVSVDKASFVVTAKGSAPLKIQPVDLDKGIFKINGFEFTWNDKETFEQNVARIQPLANAKGFSMGDAVWNLIVPSSHALEEKTINTIVISVAAVIGVALIGYFVYKAHKNSLKLKEVQARIDGGENPDRSVIGAEPDYPSSGSNKKKH
jgi:hypothetical protein